MPTFLDCGARCLVATFRVGAPSDGGFSASLVAAFASSL